MVEANIYYSMDILLDASYNRSPASYKNNPEDEREKWVGSFPYHSFLLAGVGHPRIAKIPDLFSGVSIEPSKTT